MKHTTLLLLAALVPVPALADGPPPSKGDAVYARPVHKLTAADAFRLRGKRGLWYVRVKRAMPSGMTGRLMCECESSDGVSWTFWLPPGEKGSREMVVDATVSLYLPVLVVVGGHVPHMVLCHLADAVRK